MDSWEMARKFADKTIKKLEKQNDYYNPYYALSSSLETKLAEVLITLKIQHPDALKSVSKHFDEVK